MGYSSKYFEIDKAEERISKANQYLRHHAVCGLIVLAGMCGFIWGCFFWGAR